jgi:hypothetical protein
MIKIMRQMGFDTKWLDWISNILASGKSSVLLNGVLSRHFIANGVLDKEILSPL